MQSREFGAPVSTASTLETETTVRLPDHLDQYAKISADLRHKMTPVMQSVLELMDKSVLRIAATRS